MAHLKLSFEIDAALGPAIEPVLFDAGAESVGYFDAGDAPILEPAPGDAPLWPAVAVEALFREDTDPLLVEAVLRARLATVPALAFSRLEDRVWEREWLRHFRCMRCGRRLWVCPDGQRPDAPDAIVVDLDPGLAFGTGTHPTTALCLEWLDGTPVTDRSVLDYGCGSGILAIAALRLGAARATAVDIDPQALLAAHANAVRNDVVERLEVLEPGAVRTGAYEVVLANILAGPLVTLAPTLTRLVASGGWLALSGLLAEQIDEVAQAYAGDFDLQPPVVRAGWARLAGRRRAGNLPAGDGERC